MLSKNQRFIRADEETAMSLKIVKYFMSDGPTMVSVEHTRLFTPILLLFLISVLFVFVFNAAASPSSHSAVDLSGQLRFFLSVITFNRLWNWDYLRRNRYC